MKQRWTHRVLLAAVSVFFMFSFLGCNPIALPVEDLFSEGLLAVQKDGRYGYIDEKGNKKIEFYFDLAYAFKDGVALVKVGTKWNLIDKKGAKVFEDDFAYLERDVETDLIWFVEDEKLGLMTKAGKVLADAIYDVDKSGSTYYVYANFSEGLARVSDGTTYGFLDEKGEVAIPLTYDSAGYFHEGLAYVEDNGKFGYINSKGDVAIPLTFDDANSFNVNGQALVELGDFMKLIDKKGKIVIDSMDYIYDVGTYYICEKDGKVSLYDTDGEKVGTEAYDDGGPFDLGFFGFANDDPEELLVFSPKAKLLFTLTTAEDLNDSSNFFIFDGTIWVLMIRTDKLELVNGNAKETMEFQGDDMLQIHDSFAVIRKDGKCGVVNLKDEIVVDYVYDHVKIFGDGFFAARLGTFYGILNAKGVVVVEANKYTNYVTSLIP
jgi:hypothetical protein